MSEQEVYILVVLSVTHRQQKTWMGKTNDRHQRRKQDFERERIPKTMQCRIAERRGTSGRGSAYSRADMLTRGS